MHLYVHVPFCASKCHYCGFYSVAGLGDMAAGWHDTFLSQVVTSSSRQAPPRGLAAPPPIQTVYIGGGDPSTLGVGGVSRLVQHLRAAFPLDAVEEWTVEINPGGVMPELIDALRGGGVNRMSIGVQSFDDATLARIGRRHTAKGALRAVRLAKGGGFGNVGIDLIAGLPGVGGGEWERTLRTALSLAPPHISVYALSIEPNSRWGRGGGLPDDDTLMDALAVAEGALTRAGYRRYEISNYALPGFECKHNLGVWRGNDYLGLGPSAASRVGRWRWTNPSSLEWGGLPVEREELSELDDATERVMFMLRLDEGFDPSAAVARFPVLGGVSHEWEARLERLARQGAVERVGGGWHLTARGREVCDAVIRDIF